LLHLQFFSCKYLYERGVRDNGPQLITVKGRDGSLSQVQLYCDMTNGGWTLVGEVEGWFDMCVRCRRRRRRLRCRCRRRRACAACMSVGSSRSSSM
jgi:hypothetical protein